MTFLAGGPANPCRVHVAWRRRECLEIVGIKGEQTATCATGKRRANFNKPLILLASQSEQSLNPADHKSARRRSTFVVNAVMQRTKIGASRMFYVALV